MKTKNINANAIAICLKNNAFQQKCCLPIRKSDALPKSAPRLMSDVMVKIFAAHNILTIRESRQRRQSIILVSH